MARRAFEQLVERGDLGDAAEFDVWRHHQCMQRVERPGLTQCRNEDYAPMMEHFHRLLGDEEKAAHWAQRHLTEPRTWAMARLNKECEAAADVMGRAYEYAWGFTKHKRGVALEDADEKTIWHAIYVVRRRAEQLRRKAVAT